MIILILIFYLLLIILSIYFIVKTKIITHITNNHYDFNYFISLLFILLLILIPVFGILTLMTYILQLYKIKKYISTVEFDIYESKYTNKLSSDIFEKIEDIIAIEFTNSFTYGIVVIPLKFKTKLKTSIEIYMDFSTGGDKKLIINIT